MLWLQAKNTMHVRIGQCEASKSDYAAELQKTNLTQQNHFQNLMPQVFQVFLPLVSMSHVKFSFVEDEQKRSFSKTVHERSLSIRNFCPLRQD